MTDALFRRCTEPRLNSHSNPSSTGESSVAKRLQTLTSFQAQLELGILEDTLRNPEDSLERLETGPAAASSPNTSNLQM